MYPYIHSIFYMDTYRNLCYNTGTVEKVALYLSRHHQSVQKEGLQCLRMKNV